MTTSTERDLTSPPLGYKFALVAAAFAASTLAALEGMTLPILPLIQAEFGIDAASSALLMTVLALASLVAIPLVGRLTDIYGPHRMMLAVITVTVIGGFISAFAPSFALLLVGQGAQGVGVGLLPISFAFLRERLPDSMLKPAAGVVMGVFSAGGAVGLVVAGPIAESLSRAWMFGIPTALLAFTGILILVAGDAPEAHSKTASARVDWLGAFVLALSLGLLLLALTTGPKSGWASVQVGVMSVSGLVLLCVWLMIERRVPDPLFDLAILGGRAVWTATLITIVLVLSASMASFLGLQLLALPSLTGFGGGVSPSQIGFYLLPASLIALIAAPVAGLADKKFGTRTVAAASLSLIAVGSAMLLTSTNSPIVVTAMILFGAALAAGLTCTVNAVMEAVSPDQTGVATSTLSVTRALGVAIASPLAGMLISGSGALEAGLPTLDSFHRGFGLTMLIALLGIALTLLIRQRPPNDAIVPTDTRSRRVVT